ncbi:DNA-J related domain-containing protein [Idiomarina sp.]|jgi:hypothetical protein|uniref:DNA-J related domain-containing protein n=1 Tax=Idiomarina sp. TaxID=1874361 RepID=UPI001D7CB522|nr:DNA-J related domain-containing protein [Idiomarina sp.]MCH2456271.1 DnaJ domain-containing protein [Idiomarina sp.]MCJ8316540.1 DnaJ domain-containing protein [Idiomarina sp.]NQZ15263.1 DnaJ domain-containing protein [Idiomarina sp.]
MEEDIEILIQILAECLDSQHHWTEHQLIEALQAEPYQFFDKAALRDPLNLFQTHFILFHSLYKLRERWRLQKKYELFIHTLNIECQPWQQGEKDLAENDPLAEYYLDLSQLSSTSETDVESMLNDFWERMGQDFSTKQLMPTDEACEVMELTPPLTEKQVKKQYRRLVHKYHPDKGGSVAKMQNVQKAYRAILVSLN